MKLSSAQKVTFGFGLALVILAGAGWLSFSALNRLVETSEAQKDAYIHLANLESLLSLIKDAETGQRDSSSRANRPIWRPITTLAPKWTK